MHALEVSFGLSLAAAAINLVFGARRLGAGALRVSRTALFDAIVDIPFALPTAVAGIALTNLYAENGWLGSLLAPLGIKVAYTPLGIFVALVFIGLPFVVRTVQPVLEDLEAELEEAAATLGRQPLADRSGASSCRPSLPALLTGFALAFARAVGEYGSVIFIAGNLPNVSEIAPLLIVIRLEEFGYADATAIAVVMLVASFVLLLADQPSAALVRTAHGKAVRCRCTVALCRSGRIADAGRHAARGAAHAFATPRRSGWSAGCVIARRGRVPRALHRAAAASTSSRRPSRKGIAALSSRPSSDPDARRRDPADARSPRDRGRCSICVFGVDRRVGDHQVRIPRQELLITLIDLPFSVRR